MGIDGLVSGLDTTSLINQLMQVEAMPQTMLKQKSSSTQSLVTALQGLNTKVASLAEAATKAAKPASWDLYKGTSTATSVAVKAGATAQPGSVTFSVDTVAASQISLTAAVPDDGTLLDVPPAVTIRKGDGTFVTIEPTTGSLSDIAKAINASADAGVRASVVQVSSGDGTNPATYRLQLTGVSTGTTNAFSVYKGTVDQAAVDGGTATRLDGDLVRAASSAQVTLWKGTSAETQFTSASNTFTGLMTGVDVTVSKVTAVGEDPATVTVARDEDGLKKLASGLVGAVGVVFSEITSRTTTTTKTNPDGTTSVTGGLFSGDSMVRGMRQQLTEAVSYPVDGKSPSTIGIVLGRDGTVTFDEAKFTEALAADPAGVQSMMTQLADRVGTVATGISDKVDGSLTRKITGQEQLVKDYGTQIEDWDRRLELRKASLQKTYSSLEVTLSKMQSQSNWLAGQLAGLAANNS
ncbi:acyl-CoA desaturase [Cellulomonas carbonis T26]|uniref:Flagellar hook-associated protein 2 n=2 Tax=Cellulomonas carbonis TaxID=1386092 RepID=A0A0A0BVA4_9CELL|nr:acyl-CoA desaturase [Cellulomonas carbonis T26]